MKEITDSEIKEFIDQEVVEKEPEVIKQVSWLLIYLLTFEDRI